MTASSSLEAAFGATCDLLFDQLRGSEALALSFEGEDSAFLRFNQGRVRQIGQVRMAETTLTFFRDGRTVTSGLQLTGDPARDARRSADALALARGEAALLPEDPFQTLPTARETSRALFTGRLPEPEGIPDAVLGPGAVLTAAGADFVGIHAQGSQCRGAATSAGARHWFATETFGLDYSAYLPNGKAIKSGYAGRHWDGEEYGRRLGLAIPLLEAMGRPAKAVAPGGYRVYLAPEAVNEFVPFFSWNGLGERGLREGQSSYLALRERSRRLSPRFQLTQDFSLGVEPRFNALGEVAPDRLVLIEAGELVHTLVSARSALQYGVAGNAAPEGEELRSPAIGVGELDEREVLDALGTGLYLANLHYLNWSDNDSGRITGMTRFGCFWVEHGRIIAPIQDMRFDESVYRLFGDKLCGLTRQRSLVPETGSYGLRALGGALLPGLLVEDFTLTL